MSRRYFLTPSSAMSLVPPQDDMSSSSSFPSDPPSPPSPSASFVTWPLNVARATSRDSNEGSPARGDGGEQASQPAPLLLDNDERNVGHKLPNPPQTGGIRPLPNPTSNSHLSHPLPSSSSTNIVGKTAAASHVKFIVAPEPHSFTSQTFTIDVGNCASGYDVLDKALRKVGRSRSGDSAQDDFPNATFTVDWREDCTSEGDPMSDVEIMSLCAAPPGHPTREKGLMLRRVSTNVVPRGNGNGNGYIGSPTHGSFNLHPQSQLSTSPIGSIGVTFAYSKSSLVWTWRLQNRSKRQRCFSLFVRRIPLFLERSTTTIARCRWQAQKLPRSRPSSESTTNHLQDYFTGAQKKIPDKNKKLSSKSNGEKRNIPGGMLALPVPLPLNIGAGTSGGNKRKSVMVGAAGGPGAAGITSSGNKRKTVMLSAPPPLPPAAEEGEEDQDAYGGVDASAPSDGLGRKTSLRSKRATRLNAVTEEVSLDEITAEVEHKRRPQQQQPLQEESSTLESDGWTRVDEEGETDGETDEGTLVNTEEGDDEGGDKKGKVDDEEEAAFKWVKGALMGAGSFGKVYLGMDAESGFLIAVKQVELPDEDGPNLEQKRTMLTALEREIDLLRDLQHENIVQYYYSSMDDDYLNIFLEYVLGGSVTALLQNYGAFEEPLVKNFGIIHRDIKGGNILVDHKGSIKITDFGVSKKVETATLQPGTKNKGGKNRASLQGSVTVYTKKAGIWSVGCLIVEMLTGDHPWGKLSQFQALFKIGSGTAKPNIPSDISNEAQDFLDKTFELDYTIRPSTTELLAHSWLSKKPLPFFRKPGIVREVSEPI
ncbi:kinase-like domain-containing protein [Flagelloscypha sp. PMI_526]|nr:kinase-like domain-containing protein [Flagelloscypha sp. PMI_526]